MDGLSGTYRECFGRLQQIKNEHPILQLRSPLDIPHVIARNKIIGQYRGLRLSKTGVILNSVFRIEVNPPPLSTIYFYGPDLFAEKEAVIKSPYFLCLGQRWSNGDEDTLNIERITLNAGKLTEFIEKYEENEVIREMIEATDQLSTEEIIMLSYDVVFGRDKPSGLIRTMGLEALSPIVLNTLCRLFSRARINKLFRDASIENPLGYVEIYDMENDLTGCEFPYKDCLKIGPSNNLLTYHAVYFLNNVGRRATDTSLTYMLANHYLKAVCDLCKEKKNLKNNDSLSEEEKLARIDSLKVKVKDIGKIALKNVKKSIDSLVDQRAIRKIGSTYHALGHIIKTPYGEVAFDSSAYKEQRTKALNTISEIHQLTRKRYLA